MGQMYYDVQQTRLTSDPETQLSLRIRALLSF